MSDIPPNPLPGTKGCIEDYPHGATYGIPFVAAHHRPQAHRIAVSRFVTRFLFHRRTLRHMIEAISAAHGALVTP